MKELPVLYIVIPCYNEQEALPYFYKEICRVAEEMKASHGADFEFIFVDDGSKDKTLTSAEIEEVASGVLNKISKRFGAELRR